MSNPLEALFGGEVRAVGEGARDGKPVRIVSATRSYDTDPDDLWDALTSPVRIPRWFMPIEGDLKLGGRYQLQGNAGGTILRCEPPFLLDVTWEFGGGTTWVTVTLAGEPDGTRLTLEHAAPVGEAEAHWTQYGPAAVGVGWDLSLLGLADHVAGRPHRGSEAAPSPELIAGMRASAAAWAEAHIAAGEDPDTARAMATRTAAFYTGGPG